MHGKMACGGRLKLSDFWLNHKDAGLFVKSQWPIHRYIYLAWRAFLALYLLGWLAVDLVLTGDGSNIGGFFVFLTDWTFIVLTMYAVSSCIGAIYFTFSDRSNRSADYTESTVSPVVHATTDDSSPNAGDHLLPTLTPPERPHQVATNLPHYFKLVWLLFNICLTINPIITVVFWSFLSPPQQSPLSFALNIHFHALNTVFIYIDLLLSAMPVRVVHFVYGILYGCLYAVFTLIYYWAGGVNPYTKGSAIYPNILDWSNAGRSVLVVVGITVVEPLVHLAGYGGYMLRIIIHRRYFHTVEDRSLPITAEASRSDVL